MKKIYKYSYIIIFIFSTILLFGCSSNKYRDFIYEKKGDEIIIKQLKSNAFNNTIDLIVPDGVTEIYSAALRGEKLKDITLPKSIKKIHYFPGSYINIDTLYYDGSIVDWCRITMDGITDSSSGSININRFCYYEEKGEIIHKNKKYSRLTDLFIPNEVEEIGEWQFSGINSVISVEFSNGVKKIGKYAFYGCDSLQVVKLPEEINIVDDCAFLSCKSVIRIYVPKKEINFGKAVFDANYYNIYFAGNVNDWLKLSFDYYSFKNNHNLYFANNSTPTSDADYYLLTDLIIPEGVTVINPWQFNNVIEIKNVVIPKSVKDIKGRAFEGLYGVRFYYDGSIENWLSIDFDSCVANPIYEKGSIFRILDESGAIEYNGKKYKGDYQIIIPNTISEIKTAQFAGFEFIQPIYIPKSITKINQNAFSNCSGATSVFYEGTEEDWNEITIEKGNNYLENVTIIYNS